MPGEAAAARPRPLATASGATVKVTDGPCLHRGKHTVDEKLSDQAEPNSKQPQGRNANAELRNLTDRFGDALMRGRAGDVRGSRRFWCERTCQTHRDGAKSTAKAWFGIELALLTITIHTGDSRGGVARTAAIGGERARGSSS